MRVQTSLVLYCLAKAAADQVGTDQVGTDRDVTEPEPSVVAVTGLTPELLSQVPENLRSSIWDTISDLPDLWEKGQSVISDYQCAQLPKVQDCCNNNCQICVGGKALQILESWGKFADVFSAAKVSQAQLEAGEICGMPESSCKQLTQYFDNLPSIIVRMLSWVMTVPKFYKAGECPNDVVSTVLIGSGLAGASLITYLI